MSHLQPKCSNCPYWRHIDGGEGPDDEGECHHGPPDLLVNEHGGVIVPYIAAWPPTPGTEICGQHPGFQFWLETLAIARVAG